MAATLTTRKPTVAEAAADYERYKPQYDRLRDKLKPAEAVLKEHFEKTGNATYKGKIGCARSVRRVLDQGKVTKHLGRQLWRFQKSVRILSLSLIEPAKDDE